MCPIAVAAAPDDPAAAPFATGPGLLQVEDLHVHFETSRGTVRAVEGVSYTIRPGEIVALVGESGCGKSVSALSVMRLLAKPAGRVVRGRILFEGRDLLQLPEHEMRAIRGRAISMIFQEPMTSLNPVLSIGAQLMEPLQIHLGMNDAEARARAVELLRLVGITDGERRLDQYPHQFSGGMRQRVMIAIGLACNPKLIIADEPTTALDVTIQAQILELMKDLSRRLNIALLVITHNLGIVARYADRVNVMYAARIVEEGTAEQIFGAPRHPYTLGLLRSVPRLDRARDQKLETIEGLPPNLLDPPKTCRFAPRCPYRIAICDIDPPLLATDAPEHRSACHRAQELPVIAKERQKVLAAVPTPCETRSEAALLSVRDLTKHFEVHGRGLSGGMAVVRAAEKVSFDIPRGQTLGLVGESGCGKTTVGRLILRLEESTAGQILFDGRDIVKASAAEMKALRPQIQVIFQDPFSSLNPRMTVGQIIAEPMQVHRIADRKRARQRVAELLEQVGLYPYMAERYPHQLSGGQRQRVGIARALGMNPAFIVCDEPVSALDVSIQGQIINLLEALQERLGLTYLFIAHDLAVVRHISHRVVVMYLGRIMEVAEREDLYGAPLHPYTRALLDAAPVPDPVIERARAPRALRGELPSPLSPPEGCVFHTRCPFAVDACKAQVPPLEELRPKHFVACIRAKEFLGRNETWSSDTPSESALPSRPH
ncbi:MAG TPA: ABC transporter ATP-binding protein [Beijerinckiaceae bacterium]|jgi:peptide/nickel transport system ATP-binding protein